MADLTGRFVPLNVLQRRLLRAIRPYTEQQCFFYRGAVNVRLEGFAAESVLPLMRELESVGYLKILTKRESDVPVLFVLSSGGRCYERLAAWHYFKAASLRLIEIGSGCAGGLVVWFLSRLLP